MGHQRQKDLLSMTTLETLFGGFPAKSSRGYLGWSAVYLVTTAEGRKILFDTGGYNERDSLITTLKQRGTPSESVHTVVLSHLHFDHAANWDLFPDAEILVHEREMEYALSPQADTCVLHYHARALKEHRKLRLVSGDSSQSGELQFLLMPGHTPGCMALKVGDSVLCGDALKNRWDLKGEVSPPVWDAGGFRASVTKLATLGNKLYPGHDVPLHLAESGWQPIGAPTLRISFPNGKDVTLLLD
jgi:glyoxylase-like metal-dependent hydrolase (beta-lactamase superfamily II)